MAPKAPLADELYKPAMQKTPLGRPGLDGSARLGFRGPSPALGER